MMFSNRFRVFLALVVAVAGASAQNFDACGNGCINTTLAEGICSSLNDTTCICTNTKFQTAFTTCLQNCSSSDLVAAEAYEKETCSNVSSSSNTSSSASSSATKAATSSSATASSKSASSGATAVEQLPLLSVAIVAAGVMMGGALAL